MGDDTTTTYVDGAFVGQWNSVFSFAQPVVPESVAATSINNSLLDPGFSASFRVIPISGNEVFFGTNNSYPWLCSQFDSMPAASWIERSFDDTQWTPPLLRGHPSLTPLQGSVWVWGPDVWVGSYRGGNLFCRISFGYEVSVNVQGLASAAQTPLSLILADANGVDVSHAETNVSGTVHFQGHIFHNNSYDIVIAQKPYGYDCSVTSVQLPQPLGYPTATANVTCWVATFPVFVTVEGLCGRVANLTINVTGNDPVTFSGIPNFPVYQSLALPNPVVYNTKYEAIMSDDPLWHSCVFSSNGDGTAVQGTVSGPVAISVVCSANCLLSTVAADNHFQAYVSGHFIASLDDWLGNVTFARAVAPDHVLAIHAENDYAASPWGLAGVFVLRLTNGAEVRFSSGNTTNWKCFQGSEAPPANWTMVEFDDSAWGPAVLTRPHPYRNPLPGGPWMWGPVTNHFTFEGLNVFCRYRLGYRVFVELHTGGQPLASPLHVDLVSSSIVFGSASLTETGTFVLPGTLLRGVESAVNVTSVPDGYNCTAPTQPDRYDTDGISVITCTPNNYAMSFNASGVCLSAPLSLTVTGQPVQVIPANATCGGAVYLQVLPVALPFASQWDATLTNVPTTHVCSVNPAANGTVGFVNKFTVVCIAVPVALNITARVTGLCGSTGNITLVATDQVPVTLFGSEYYYPSTATFTFPNLLQDGDKWEVNIAGASDFQSCAFVGSNSGTLNGNSVVVDIACSATCFVGEISAVDTVSAYLGKQLFSFSNWTSSRPFAAPASGDWVFSAAINNSNKNSFFGFSGTFSLYTINSTDVFSFSTANLTLWKCYQGLTAPPAGWTFPSFDDSMWPYPTALSSLAPSLSPVAGSKWIWGSNTAATEQGLNYYCRVRMGHTIEVLATGVPSPLSITVTPTNGTGVSLTVPSDGLSTFFGYFPFSNGFTASLDEVPANYFCSLSYQSAAPQTTTLRINVTCVPRPYYISVEVNGLCGPSSQLSLRATNNADMNMTGIDDMPVRTAGAFSMGVLYNSNYLVEVSRAPALHQCTVTNGAGVMRGNITVSVTCVSNCLVARLAGDNALRAHINGTQMASSDDWRADVQFARPVEVGNVLSVHVRNDDMAPPAGFCGWIKIRPANTQYSDMFFTTTADSPFWTCYQGAAPPSPSYVFDDFDDSAWLPPRPYNNKERRAISGTNWVWGDVIDMSLYEGLNYFCRFHFGDRPSISVSGLSGLNPPGHVSMTVAGTSNGVDLGSTKILLPGTSYLPKWLFLGEPYELQITQQPSGYDCVVASNAGRIPDVSPVVQCVPYLLNVTVNVTGILGSISNISIAVNNNTDFTLVGDDSGAAVNALYTFPNQLPYGTLFVMSITDYPDSHDCEFRPADSGIVSFSTFVNVVCTTNSIEGVLSGDDSMWVWINGSQVGYGPTWLSNVPLARRVAAGNVMSVRITNSMNSRFLNPAGLTGYFDGMPWFTDQKATFTTSISPFWRCTQLDSEPPASWVSDSFDDASWIMPLLLRGTGLHPYRYPVGASSFIWGSDNSDTTFHGANFFCRFHFGYRVEVNVNNLESASGSLSRPLRLALVSTTGAVISELFVEGTATYVFPTPVFKAFSSSVKVLESPSGLNCSVTQQPFGSSTDKATSSVNCEVISSCRVSDWTEWSDCSPQWTQTRSRTVLVYPTDPSDVCPVLTQTQTCQKLPPFDTLVKISPVNYPNTFLKISAGYKTGSYIIGNATGAFPFRLVAGLAGVPNTVSFLVPGSILSGSFYLRHDDINVVVDNFDVTADPDEFARTASFRVQWGRHIAGTVTLESIAYPGFFARMLNGEMVLTQDDGLAEFKIQSSFIISIQLSQSIDCELSNSWSSWSACPSGCGYASRFRYRSVLSSPMLNGASCPAVVQLQSCRRQACTNENQQILTNTGTYEFFRELHLEGIDLRGVRGFIFSVKTITDAHLVVSEYYNNYRQNAFEITLGDCSGSSSTIRRGRGGPVVASVSRRVVSFFEPRTFWVAWTDGYIIVGRGRSLGDDWFLAYQTGRTVKVNYVAAASLVTSAQWAFDRVNGSDPMFQLPANFETTFSPVTDADSSSSNKLMYLWIALGVGAALLLALAVLYARRRARNKVVELRILPTEAQASSIDVFDNDEDDAGFHTPKGQLSPMRPYSAGSCPVPPRSPIRPYSASSPRATSPKASFIPTTVVRPASPSGMSRPMEFSNPSPPRMAVTDEGSALPNLVNLHESSSEN